MIKVQNTVIKKQPKFWNHALFHPTDAVEDPWGKRILDRMSDDGAIKTIRIYTMFEDIVYLDENDQIITESKTFKITSAEVDVEGRVANATNETIVLSTNGESINDVLNTKKIILALSLESRDNDSRIYFQTTDAIEIKLSAFIKVKASISAEEDIE